MADQVYKLFKQDNLFTNDINETLCLLMAQIRLSIKGTDYSLKHNYINFEEILTKPLCECSIKIDLSLIPHYSQEDEYILWLAGFIEKITVGGRRAPPPIKKFIPEMENVKLEFQNQTIREKKKRDHAEEITRYFDSQERRIKK